MGTSISVTVRDLSCGGYLIECWGTEAELSEKKLQWMNDIISHIVRSYGSYGERVALVAEVLAIDRLLPALLPTRFEWALLRHQRLLLTYSNIGMLALVVPTGDAAFLDILRFTWGNNAE